MKELSINLNQISPIISIIVGPTEGYTNLLEMITENIGQGIAQDIKFQVELDFEYAKGVNLSEIGILQHGIKYLFSEACEQKLLTWR